MNIWHSAQKKLAVVMGELVTQALKQLLSEKHLYQYAELNWEVYSAFEFEVQENLEKELGDYTASAKTFIAGEKQKLIETIWVPNPITDTSYKVLADSVPVGFKLPTINTFCDHCKDRWPFNPVSEGSYMIQGLGQGEFFYLGYQCQQCKGPPIRFLIRREGVKLRLAGRYPLEVLPTPKELPKKISKYYGNALIAYHAGQTLAGLFFLRVFIEQFWRTIPAVQQLIATKPKATGDEQGSTYQGTLPSDFKSRFPSLTDIYDKLSEAIHTASENAELFEEARKNIVKHFAARELFEFAS